LANAQTDRYMAVDGCSTNAELAFNAAGYYDMDTASAEIVCCSLDGTTSSRFTPDGECRSGQDDVELSTWQAANDHCEAEGMRLCVTQAEVDLSCSTGCSFDARVVWTGIKEGSYYGADGCSTNPIEDWSDDQDPGFYSGDSASGEVVCCEMDGSDCYRQNSADGLCHSGSGDEFKVTWFEAYWICQNQGYRLCETQGELDHCCGSGCSYDNQVVWTSLEEVGGSEEPAICRLTIDAMITSVTYGGESIVVSGDLTDSTTLNTFSFTPVAGAVLEIQGYAGDDCDDGCTCAGLLLECNNGIITHDVFGWTAYGNDSAEDVPIDEDYADICESTSEFTLADQYSEAVPIWPSNGGAYAWFRYTPISSEYGYRYSIFGNPQEEANTLCTVEAPCNPQISQESELLAVRCVSDTEIVGWAQNSSPVGTCDPNPLWHESDAWGVCHTLSYADAVSLCESEGARLPTLDEVERGCVPGSGCGFDNQYIWTSTQHEPQEYYTMVGNSQSAGCLASEDACAESHVSEFTELAVRCVSDIEITGWAERSTCGETIWTESDAWLVGEEGCQLMTWWDANLFCQQQGGRLPTVEELIGGCIAGSGCGYDAELIWSSTVWVPPMYYAVQGAPLNVAGDDYITVAANELQPVRCVTTDASLGWLENFTDECTIDYALYSESDDWTTGDECHYLDWDDATAFCESVGGRLPTFDEVMMTCVQGSGCGFNSEYIWTSTEYMTSTRLTLQDCTDDVDYVPNGDIIAYGEMVDDMITVGIMYPGYVYINSLTFAGASSEDLATWETTEYDLCETHSHMEKTFSYEELSALTTLTAVDGSLVFSLDLESEYDSMPVTMEDVTTVPVMKTLQYAIDAPTSVIIDIDVTLSDSSNMLFDMVSHSVAMVDGTEVIKVEFRTFVSAAYEFSGIYTPHSTYFDTAGISLTLDGTEAHTHVSAGEGVLQMFTLTINHKPTECLGTHFAELDLGLATAVEGYIEDVHITIQLSDDTIVQCAPSVGELMYETSVLVGNGINWYNPAVEAVSLFLNNRMYIMASFDMDITPSSITLSGMEITQNGASACSECLSEDDLALTCDSCDADLISSGGVYNLSFILHDNILEGSSVEAVDTTISLSFDFAYTSRRRLAQSGIQIPMNIKVQDYHCHFPNGAIAALRSVQCGNTKAAKKMFCAREGNWEEVSSCPEQTWLTPLLGLGVLSFGLLLVGVFALFYKQTTIPQKWQPVNTQELPINN